MTRILLIGATGYVGTNVASALVRSGNHTVYGLARSPAKAAQLAVKEVIPVIGDVEDSSAYIALIKSANIHVVVDCSGANHGSHKILADLKKVAEERLRSGLPKLGFVYTSGMWVHGSSVEKVSDLDPVGTKEAKNPPARLVAWRPELERNILASKDVLNVAIVRPALVYGYEHSIWSGYFGAILAAKKEGKPAVQVPLGANTLPGLVHIDDAAAGFLAVISKLELINTGNIHPIFNLFTSSESMTLILKSVGTAIGYKGEVQLVDPDKEDIFSEAMATNSVGESSRAKNLLGWEPKRIGFVANVEVLAQAWLGTQK